MSSKSPVDIYSYPLTTASGPTTVQQALTLLRPHLPICIPLYRRLQTNIFSLESRLLTNLPTLTQQPGDEPWVLAFLDRTRRPETELYLFGSLESTLQTSSSTTARREGEGAAALLSALFKHIRSLPLPPSIHTPSLTTTTSHADYTTHLLNPTATNILKCGAIHANSIPFLQASGVITPSFAAGLRPNHEYVFDLDEEPLAGLLASGEGDVLPDGLRWGELKHAHFARVRASTQILRLEGMLAVLPNVGIFPTSTGDADPVAWAFVGLDGSLTALHVEPEWRGKGLAKKITVKMFKEKMEMFWEEGMPRLAHDYVVSGNMASVGLSNSLGGKSEWDSYWVRVDLSLIEDWKTCDGAGETDL